MKSTKVISQVERAAAELRRGQIVDLENSSFVVGSPENLDSKLITQLKKLTKNSEILISGKRAGYLFSKPYSSSISIELNKTDDEIVYKISGLSAENLSPKIIQSLEKSVKKPEKDITVILKLARIAELIPAMILFKKNPKINKYIKDNDVIKINGKNIEKYEGAISGNLTKVSTTPLILKDAKNARIVAFRPQIGGKEHYAIIIGNPAGAAPVRIHSSCYTGDLLGSLRCDCRDQLHETIKFMGEEGGGIVIYLIQEGRGIGLVNKLRAYDLQYQGYDTVEANEFLGFGDDERPFLPAANILKQLGVTTIRLISNNPKKSEELKKLGITVKEMLPIIIAPNEHNRCYIKTKTRKMRHKISI